MSSILKNIDNIIFDLGGVILEIDLEIIKTGFIKLGFNQLESGIELFKHNQIFQEFERGEIEPNVFRDEIRTLCPKQFTDTEFDEVWNSVILNYPKENIELLQSLQNKYSMYLLSNTNKIHYDLYTEILKKQFGVEKLDLLFNKAYYSHSSGMRKPDSAFFELVIKENNLNPERTLFIDDFEENIAAAKLLGIKTLHLTDFKLVNALVSAKL